MPLAGIVMSVDETRLPCLLAAGAAVELLVEERTVKAWDRPCVLEGISVVVLAAHLARSVLQIGWFLVVVLHALSRRERDERSALASSSRTAAQTELPRIPRTVGPLKMRVH